MPPRRKMDRYMLATPKSSSNIAGPLEVCPNSMIQCIQGLGLEALFIYSNKDAKQQPQQNY